MINSVLLASLLAVGCGQVEPEIADAIPVTTDTDVTSSTTDSQPPAPDVAGMDKMKFPAPEDIKFKDSLESNVDLPKAINELVFTNKDGTKIRMADYVDKMNVILVFTEGFNGMICPFCQTQTSRLVANYEEFQQRDCEVIVVYPGPEEKLGEFIEAALKTEKEQVDDVPFPIALDTDFRATDFFDIHSKHAHPSTYLIDKQGNVKFAYVGTDMTADRPSVKALLNRLDNLE